MAEYLELEKVLDDKNIITVQTREYGSIEVIPVDTITDIELADVQPLSVVAEHIKNRLYETAFNEPDTVARNAIADMAGRVDFWVNELKDGDTE